MEETARRAQKLVRSQDDRVFAGVAGGLGEYLGVDVVWVRLVFVLASLVWGLGLLVYALLWITLPEQGEEEGAGDRPPMVTENPRGMAGVLLLTLGLLILLWKVLSLLTLKIVIPVILVGLGLFLLAQRRQ